MTTRNSTGAIKICFLQPATNTNIPLTSFPQNAPFAPKHARVSVEVAITQLDDFDEFDKRSHESSLFSAQPNMLSPLNEKDSPA